MSGFSLKYLGKFLYGKKIQSLAINGGFMPLNDISMNSITLLNLANQGLYSEDLFILSQYLKRNQSITHLNLSKNFIGLHSASRQNMARSYSSLGVEHFALALQDTDRIVELDLSSNDIGSDNFEFLQRIFKSNTNIELLNLDNCRIDEQQVKKLCEVLTANKRLRYMYLSNNPIRIIGSQAVSRLILSCTSLVELDLFNCKINEQGASEIGAALRQNFGVQKLSIGQNEIPNREIEIIQSSVVFNTNYYSIKLNNDKFDGFAHNLIAETLKKWALGSPFVA